ncbi:MAG: hypothetical protein ACI8S6_002758 [Myxococcota bacterium]|jgi:hypothetical protein
MLTLLTLAASGLAADLTPEALLDLERLPDAFACVGITRNQSGEVVGGVALDADGNVLRRTHPVADGFSVYESLYWLRHTTAGGAEVLAWTRDRDADGAIDEGGFLEYRGGLVVRSGRALGGTEVLEVTDYDYTFTPSGQVAGRTRSVSAFSQPPVADPHPLSVTWSADATEAVVRSFSPGASTPGAWLSFRYVLEDGRLVRQEGMDYGWVREKLIYVWSDDGTQLLSQTNTDTRLQTVYTPTGTQHPCRLAEARLPWQRG